MHPLSRCKDVYFTCKQSNIGHSCNNNYTGTLKNFLSYHIQCYHNGISEVPRNIYLISDEISLNEFMVGSLRLPEIRISSEAEVMNEFDNDDEIEDGNFDTKFLENEVLNVVFNIIGSRVEHKYINTVINSILTLFDLCSNDLRKQHTIINIISQLNTRHKREVCFDKLKLNEIKKVEIRDEMNPLPSIESPIRIYYVPFKVMLMDMIKNVRIQEELVFEADDSPGTYSSIFSGRIAKEYIEKFGKCLFFAVYVDDFSPNSRSSLSSKALTICNIHLLNLPDHFRSKIDSILMTLCCQSNVSKKTNYNYPYDIICSEINTLHGKTITIKSETYTIFFIVFIGDNKEVNAAMGIKDSFHGKSSRPCRSCTATTTQFTKIFEEKCCVKRRTNPPSKFLEICDYKLNDRPFFDISHDFYLGTATFAMGMIICKIIKEAKFCSLEELNSCISKFYFGTSDKPNRIKVIDSKISGNHMLGQHSEQCRSLIRYFPLIIHSIKELKYDNVDFTNDIVLETMMLKMKDTMEIFENLRYIEELMSSPYIDDIELLILDSLVKKYLVFISQNRPTLRLREHNMVHFSSAIRSYGPLCNIASLRYESFHQVAKKFCMSSNNKLNLPFTIMKKNQTRHNILKCRNFNINHSQKYTPRSNDIVLITRSTENKRLLSQRSCNKQVKSKYQLVKIIDDLDDNNFRAYILDFYCKISSIHFFDVGLYESNITKFNLTNLVSTKAEKSQPLDINSGLCEIKAFMFGTSTRFFDSDKSKHFRINVENEIKSKLFY